MKETRKRKRIMERKGDKKEVRKILNLLDSKIPG